MQDSTTNSALFCTYVPCLQLKNFIVKFSLVNGTKERPIKEVTRQSIFGNYSSSDVSQNKSLSHFPYFRFVFDQLVPIPVAARSKAWVCGRSPTEIVGSNPTGGMDVCLL